MIMPLLQLWFDSSEKTELTRTVFEHPATGARFVAVRGKSETPYRASGSFQWSPAVRAMCMLLLHSKTLSIYGIGSKAVLKSASRGPVSAFDYAIGRSAQWIQDVFGVTKRGEPVARRIFFRGNPERKRPGPISISLNTSFLVPEEVEVYLNERQLLSGSEIDELLRTLKMCGEISFSNEVNLRGEITEHSFSQMDWIESLTCSFIEEAKGMLRTTNVFSRKFIRESCSFISHASLLSSVQKTLIESIHQTHIKPAASIRLGVQYPVSTVQKELFCDGPLRFGVTPSQIGTLALLRYLQNYKQYPLEVDYSFNHTCDLVEAMDAGISEVAPDCCVITTASYALLSPQARNEYIPLMVMPSASHSVLSPNKVKRTPGKALRFQLLDDFPTTPSLWLDSLVRAGALSGCYIEREHSDPDEALEALRGSQDANLRCILWFPYNLIATDLFGAIPQFYSYKGAPSEEIFIQNILLVKRSRIQTTTAARIISPRILVSLFTDAWLTLLEYPSLCTQLVREQVADLKYRRMIWRYSGLYRFERNALRV